MAFSLRSVKVGIPPSEACHRFLLVEDHPLFADGFSSALSKLYPHSYLRHEPDGTSAKKLMQKEDFDLVFLDVHLPDTNGLYLLGELFKQSIWQPIAILTARPDAVIVEHAKQWGALGVISKRSDLMHLQSVCEKILQGGKHYEKESFDGAVSSALAMNTLTPREIEVLRVLAEGEENRNICQFLRISESTLKTHLKSLFQKLNVTNRTACVIKGLREGLI